MNPRKRTKASRVRGFTPYLHRKEGDQGTPAYWYRRTGEPVRGEPPNAEWVNIVEALLA
jgi:hypothetical protein